MTKEEALTELRRVRRICEVQAAQARMNGQSWNARHFGAKVEAYDTAEALILAIKVPFNSAV